MGGRGKELMKQEERQKGEEKKNKDERNETIEFTTR